MPSDVRHSRANLRSTLEVDRLTAIRAPLNLTPTKPRAAELCLKLPMYRIYGPVIQCRRAKYSTRYHCESRTAAIPIVTGEFCNWLFLVSFQGGPRDIDWYVGRDRGDEVRPPQSQRAVMPPSTTISVPVTKRASSEARNSAA